jgi:two-component system, response regulator PdtaR
LKRNQPFALLFQLKWWTLVDDMRRAYTSRTISAGPRESRLNAPMSDDIPKRKILVVDGDQAYARRVAELLCRAGYDATANQSAEGAMAAAAISRPDVALVDDRLTAESGLTLGASLRSKFALPFIILSGLEDAEAARQATQIGASAHLLKSAHLHHYLPTVHASLGCLEELRASRQREEQLSIALQQKRAISAATGVLMERSSFSRAQAFERLRGLARAQRRRLNDIAEQLLDSVECLNGVVGTQQRVSLDTGES